MVYNPPTKQYVMWYENFNFTAEVHPPARPSLCASSHAARAAATQFKRCCVDSTSLDCCQGNYSVATSASASGGFVTKYQGGGGGYAPAKCTCCAYQACI